MNRAVGVAFGVGAIFLLIANQAGSECKDVASCIKECDADTCRSGVYTFTKTIVHDTRMTFFGSGVTQTVASIGREPNYTVSIFIGEGIHLDGDFQLLMNSAALGGLIVGRMIKRALRKFRLWALQLMIGPYSHSPQHIAKSAELSTTQLLAKLRTIAVAISGQRHLMIRWDRQPINMPGYSVSVVIVSNIRFVIGLRG